MVVTWKNEGQSIAFEMSGNSDGWVAVGFSEDKKMVRSGNSVHILF